MGPVAHPVHQPQRPMIESAFRQVVLDKDKFPADAASLPKYHAGIGRVVKHINQEANIEGIVRKRQVRSIKDLTFDGTNGPLTDLDALDFQTGYELSQPSGKCPVATTHIQKTAVRRKLDRQLLRQDGDSPIGHDLAVNPPDQLGAGARAHASRQFQRAW